MTIVYNESNSVFHLQTHKTSYLIEVLDTGHLAHLYWGQRIESVNTAYLRHIPQRSFSPNPVDPSHTYNLDTLPQEYPAYGNTDYREPAYQVQLENGSTISNLRYETHRIFKGKPALRGLPATYVESDDEATTLEIDLVDEQADLQVTLSYTTFEQMNVITRSARFVNEGESPIRLLRCLSANVDFPHDSFDVLHLSGAWGRERIPVRQPLRPGMQSINSRRGASSHQHNPFFAIMSADATEDHGDVYALNLVYSGNFDAFAEVDQYHTTRVGIGINPFDFTWLLGSKEVFQTPETVLVYAANGLGEMSRDFHQLYRSRLARSTHRDRIRPVLINNWEATYFDFDTAQIEALAAQASELGIELFVLDDGWFGKRDDDKSSLGDWFVNTRKLPEGLCDLAKRINDKNMKFGLWFEPEMVSPDSELYRAHPDWCLHVPNRPRSQSRNQLVLDLSRDDVCDAIVEMVSAILNSANIEYVKWDMNRHMTEIGSALLPPERQRETAHRYMLGLYRVLDELTTAFPHVLFESCSGGGGRFDPGMLYYMPQTWTSDNTDAIERLGIQYGTSLTYPAISMGAHVSAVPNHQVYRTTPLETRGHVAMAGTFGYELDLMALTDEERKEIKDQVTFYKSVRELVQFGHLYRLLNPNGKGSSAWMYVSNDRRSALVTYVHTLAEADPRLVTLRLKGLEPRFKYHVSGMESEVGGDQLMYVGLNVPVVDGDFKSFTWHLTQV
ncbi:alpha-galactosidase [Alicyclobacillus dauci]|uniref:Alpha-galactosidase n=1 Tax=Alicyclobacillus dauci TaxID=1475485 RepID=A0ABY6Z0B3_9BACL|nr:alpha-galactosidase [Alicyclobacillus dauci]WAH36271.1 alpha-galactosidase [Alicyclobacillus dauci]WAH39408.1 alpha-galactosidase [Alicyclobacillus dauci]